MVAVPVIAAVSLVNAIKFLSPAQRNMTVLHVLFSGFTDTKPWFDWMQNLTRSACPASPLLTGPFPIPGLPARTW